MALSMSFFVSFVLVSINFGYNSAFFQNWLKIWSQAFICAFFGAYFFPKIIQQFMNKINFSEKSLVIRNDVLMREQNNKSGQ